MELIAYVVPSPFSGCGFTFWYRHYRPPATYVSISRHAHVSIRMVPPSHLVLLQLHHPNIISSLLGRRFSSTSNFPQSSSGKRGLLLFIKSPILNLLSVSWNDYFCAPRKLHSMFTFRSHIPTRTRRLQQAGIKCWTSCLLKSKSKLLYDIRSVSQSALVSKSLWNLWPDISSCRKVAVLSLWGALSDERTGLQFAVQSLSGSSRKEPVTILYPLIWDSPNLEDQVPVFISPGSGWPSYTSGHWVPFTSPLTTRRATVEYHKRHSLVS
jgi:hypothetical protein